MWSSPSIPDLQQDEAPQECEPPEKMELLSDLACFRYCKPWLPGSRTGFLGYTWNCRNLVMPAYTLRPHLTASTMLPKRLSSSRMSEASLATLVPVHRIFLSG